ncbi:MAG: hypothetical protein AAFP89_12210 [Bacteroidota bacterium]
MKTIKKVIAIAVISVGLAGTCLAAYDHLTLVTEQQDYSPEGGCEYSPTDMCATHGMLMIGYHLPTHRF